MNAPSVSDVVKHLKQLRESLSHAIRGGNLVPERFNDATKQLRALDAELLKLGFKPTDSSKGKPHAAWDTRKHRRDATRSQGNTLELRIKEKAQRKRIAQHGDADIEGPV